MQDSQKASEVREKIRAEFTREEMKKVGERASRSCVYIHVGSKEPLEGGPSIGEGAGFFVGKNLIVTNAHVAQEGTNLNVHVTARKQGALLGAPFKQVVQARILASDIENDLAVIELVQPRSVPVLKFSEEDEPTHGTEHLLMKNSRVNGPSFTKGTFLKRAPMGEINGSARRLDVLKFSGKIESGDSGSPVVNKRGDVIGVTSANLDGNQVAFAVPLEYVKRLVKSAREVQVRRKD